MEPGHPPWRVWSLSHIDRDHSVVDLDERAELRGLGSSVDAVIGCIDGNAAAIDLDACSFDSLRCCDINCATVNDGVCRSLNAIITGRDVECAACDVDVSDRGESLLQRFQYNC